MNSVNIWHQHTARNPTSPHLMWWKMLPHLFVQMKGQRGGQKDKRRQGGVRVWNVTQTSLLFCCLHFLYSMTHFYLLVAPLGVSLFSSTCLFNLSLLFAMLDNICQIWYFLCVSWEKWPMQPWTHRSESTWSPGSPSLPCDENYR